MADALQNLDVAGEIVAGTRDVFSTMIMMDLEAGPVLPRDEVNIQSNLTSMLGLGGGMRGTLAVHCPKEVATGITSAFLGMDIEEIDADVKDSIGEIVNMIAGNLKVTFAGVGIAIELAIPTSATGEAIRLCGLAGANRLLVPLTCVNGTFWVELLFVLN